MADVESWKRWRRNREDSLASEYGWLTLTSFQWLPAAPGRIDLFPGLWSVDGGAAVLEAAAPEGIVEHDGGASTEPDVPLVGTHHRSLGEGESLLWVRHGSTVVELGLRDARYMVRTRERRTTALDDFGGVPTFPHDAAWVVSGRFEPADRPRRVGIATYRDDTRLTATAVGEVVFEIEDREHRLTAVAGGSGELILSFHDQTNGVTTPAWRFLTAAPAADGTVVLDFNRTLDYPFVFTPHAVCPAPVDGNRLDLSVTAGEQLP